MRYSVVVTTVQLQTEKFLNDVWNVAEGAGFLK